MSDDTTCVVCSFPLASLCIVHSALLAPLLTSGWAGTLCMIPMATHSMCCLWEEEWVLTHSTP